MMIINSLYMLKICIDYIMIFQIVPDNRRLLLKLVHMFTSNLHPALLICIILATIRIGLCRSISLEIGPVINLSSSSGSVDVPAKSPHSFDDFQYLIHIQPNRLEAKNISLGIKYFAGETTVKQTTINPLKLSHISSHLWSAYVGKEKLAINSIGGKYDVSLYTAAGIGIIAERVGFTKGYSFTSNGIVYNLSTSFSFLPSKSGESKRIKRYYIKLDLFFLKDTFDYENLHIDQNARIEEFRKLVLSEIGIDYRWFGSVSVKLFARVCHFDKSSRIIIGSGLNF